MNEPAIQKAWITRLTDVLSGLTDIPDAAKESLARRLHCIRIAKNEHFITAGERPDSMAFVAEGLFRVYYISATGKDSCLVFRESGRFLSAYNSLLDNAVSKFSFQALEDSVLLYVTLRDYALLLAEDDCWQRVVSKYFQILYVEKEERELEILTTDAKSRYERFLAKYPALPGRISQYHIASYLGITPEALSRIRSRSLT